jgi:hypothetical protein
MMAREEWLNKLTESLRSTFADLGHPLPDKLRISCGWPSSHALANKKGMRVVKSRFFVAGLCALFVMAGPVDAKKKPKPPDQDPIVQGCVVVDEIHFQPSAFYNTPGLRAIVHNNCNKAADVVVKVALFDAQGTQLDGDSASQDIAPRTAWSFFIPVPAQYQHGLSTDVKMIRIIRVGVL